jgi:hypothetical protein
MLRTPILLFILSVAVLFGCRKRSQPASPPAEPAAIEPTPATTPAAPTAKPAISTPGVDKIEDRLPTAPPNSSQSNPVDQKLTEALHRYNERTGKMPMDFNVLVAGKFIETIPKAPPGKRYAIDRLHMQVVLINQ